MNGETNGFHKILLVEDQAVIAMQEARTIRKYGYEVTMAYSGEEAVRMVDKDAAFSMVLMDIDLGGGMDGTEAARKILTNHRLPIVFLTNHAEKEYVDKVKKITSYGYVLKSAGEFVLMETISMAYNLFYSHRELERENEERKQAEAKRDEFQRLLSSTLDSVDCLLMVIDNQFRIVLSNWKDHEWVPVAERQSLPLCYEVIKNYKAPCPGCPPQKTFQDGKERRYEDRNPLDGSYKEISVVPILDSQGRVEFVLENVRDITERVRYEQLLKEKTAEQSLLLENIDAQAWYLTDMETYGRVNLAHAEFLGMTKEEIEYKKFDEFLSPEVAKECRVSNRKVFERRETVYSAEWLPNADGEQRLISISKTPKFNEDGDIEYVVCVGTDITERTRTEQALAESEARYRTILEAIPDLMFVLDREGTYLDYHASDRNALYTAPENFLGKNVREIMPGRIVDPFLSSIDGALTTNEVQLFEYGLEISGETRYFEARISPYGNDRVLSIVREITENKLAESALRESEQHYTTLFENAPVTMWEEDFSEVAERLAHLKKDGVSNISEYLGKNSDRAEKFAALIKVLDVNQSAVDLAGCTSKEELLGSLEKTYTSASNELLKSQLEAIWEEQSVLEETGEIQTVHGDVRDVVMRWQALADTPRPYSRVLVSFLDITKRKQAEGEKEFLLRELNHRVKNNLAMLSSLIHLKDEELGSQVDLSDLHHQVEAVRIVHEKLHTSGTVKEINMREYTEDILSTVFSSFTSRGIRVVNEVENVSIATRKAVALGLIINELATNAIKYGFGGNQDHYFTVSLKREPDKGQYELAVGNTGAPFPAKIGLENPSTLGLRLVTTLVEQLRGSVELQKHPRPVFTIRLPLETESERK